MRQYVLCNGCGSQQPPPEGLETEPNPQFIRCNHCGQEFFWDGELKETLEPHWIDPSEESAGEAIPGNETRDFPDLLGRDRDSNFELELELEPEIEQTDVEASNEMPLKGSREESSEETDWSVLGASAPIRRRKEASAIRKILPPILGGLAAFPIATAIMWYGFGRDLAFMGPTVAQYAPWVVPEKLRDMPDDIPQRQSRRIPRAPRQLPTINRPEPEENVVRQPAQPIQEDNTPAPRPEMEKQLETTAQVDKPIEENERLDETQSLSRTIAKLQSLQEDWASTPKDNRAMQVMMISRYCTEIQRLAQLSSDLKGRSGAVWWKEIDSLARAILAHQNLPTVIQFSATGKWPEVPAAKPGEFLATIVLIGEGNEPDAGGAWLLKEKWRYGDKDVKIEVQPDALRNGSASPVRGSSLVFGKLVADKESDTPGELTLQAHAIILP